MGAGLRGSAVTPGFIVQVWGEAAANAEARALINTLYSDALGLLGECSVRWLTESRGLTPEAAPAQATVQVSAGATVQA